MVATWAISFLSLVDLDIFFSSSTTASTACSMPRLSAHGVGAGGDVLEALAEDGLGQDGGGGGAVAGDVGGLGGDLLDHLGAHVLVVVLQLDLLGDGHAVLGDGRAAELLVDDDVAALGAQRDLDGVGQDVDAAQERRAGFLFELESALTWICSSGDMWAGR